MTVQDNCCGSPCAGEGIKGEPCYGHIDVVDEVLIGDEEDGDWQWVHACDGHRDWPGKYIPEEKK